MVITYLGTGFIKVTFGETVIALNPTSKEFNGKSARFGADVVLVSAPLPAFAGVEGLTGGGKEPFVIDGPGEYEHSDIFIKGYPSAGPAGTVNTIYSFLLEGMRVVSLGALATADLASEIIEDISGADILIVPTGAEDSLAGRLAGKLASALDPKIIIPVLHEGLKSAGLKEFMDEAGEPAGGAQDKLSLKKKDLEGKEAEVVVLEAI
ncbi:MAG: hypothetical protein A2571_02030 [Candidatus Vogelbacteria bacterium RIFOXYD1_FULL_44_32]|uniref:Lactamase n=1 Tax=Candidatus Vogelbacteria bacterium RIFOXYD1_FULL_44_32 TaxID=1802438 RepID=A0A1G2QEV3_9BACT|nr:MAG: hypothetical protein A2571_02030 [Candidatus Vogelbacteria bacterium RIFOXYD1_FULL_44_32]